MLFLVARSSWKKFYIYSSFIIYFFQNLEKGKLAVILAQHLHGYIQLDQGSFGGTSGPSRSLPC